MHGSVLLQALENSVSDAHTDGRFLHFSGLRVVANWHRPEGERVLRAIFCPSEEEINEGKTYTIAMTSFIASGFDGYTCLGSEETLVSEEGAMTDTSLLLQIFRYLPAGQHSLSNGHGETQSQEEDETVRGIERTRRAIILGQNEADGLPVVGPQLDGRMSFIDE